MKTINCKKGPDAYSQINSECFENCGWNNAGRCAFMEGEVRELVRKKVLEL